jgi:hydroxypyruvate isomerase
MRPSSLTRRDALKSGLAVTALASFPAQVPGETAVPVRKNRIHQSACKWCYKDIPLDQLCAFAAGIGMKGIDLLSVDE